jgi:tetratricopeptide (TPR) repeat protein
MFFLHIQTSIALIERTANVIHDKGVAMIRPLFERDEPIIGPMDAEALTLLKEGDALLDQGELDAAENAFQKSVSAGGGSAALRKLLDAQLARRAYDRAAKTLHTLKGEGASDEDIALISALMELHQGHVDRAVTVLTPIASLPQGKYGLALVAIVKNNHEQARELLSGVSQGAEPTLRAYARSILAAYDEFSLFPEGKPEHLGTLLARALADVHECALALPLATSAVDSEPDYRDAWIVKGYCELTTARSADALSSFEQAYNIDPEKPEVQYFLARAYEATGDPKNAVTFLRYAIQNGFTPVSDARLLLARYAAELGDNDLALEQYRAMTRDEGSTIVPFEKFVNLALTLPGKGSEATDIADAALRAWPDDPRALTLAVRAAHSAGDDAKAHTIIDAALKADPLNETAHQLKKSLP